MRVPQILAELSPVTYLHRIIIGLGSVRMRPRFRMPCVL